MRRASEIIGPMFLLALVVLPFWLQVSGRSPLWILPFAWLFSIFWLPLDRRAQFEAIARELHGAKAGNVIYVKPAFMATWIAIVVYALTFAVQRWIL